MVSLRNIDSYNESKVAEFTDEFVYKGKTERIFDKTLQIQGIDVKYGNINIDEKAQSSKSYFNKPIPSLALEVSFINRANTEQIGWFVKENLTTHYAFIRINKGTMNEYNVIESIDEIRYIVYKKETLEDYVYYTYQVDKDILLKAASELRESGLKVRYIKGLKLVCSQHLKEKPVNIVLTDREVSKFSIKDNIYKRYE